MAKLLILLARLAKLFLVARPAKPAVVAEVPHKPIPEQPKEVKVQEKITKIGTAGLNLIKEFEGLRLKAYLDEAGIPTIGYGHTKGVKMGDVITQEQATEYLKEDVVGAEGGVIRFARVALTQNQFDALVCFAFNVGVGALGSSTLLKKLNSGDYSGAADQFLVWNKLRENGILRVSNGLSRRRAAERELFLKA